VKKLPGRNLVLIPFLFAPFLSSPCAPAAEEPRDSETRLVAYLARAQGEPGEKESILRTLANVGSENYGPCFPEILAPSGGGGKHTGSGGSFEGFCAS